MTDLVLLVYCVSLTVLCPTAQAYGKIYSQYTLNILLYLWLSLNCIFPKHHYYQQTHKSFLQIEANIELVIRMYRKYIEFCITNINAKFTKD